MKILHAEDNEDMQRLYARIIFYHNSTNGTNHEVVTISDGSKALSTALAEHPDLILLDYMMPNMNGIDALEALKASDETKHIPVVMLSAYEDDELLMRAMHAGAARYLVKGNIEPGELVPLLTETLSASVQNNPTTK